MRSFDIDFPPLVTVAVMTSSPSSSAVATPFSILTLPFLLSNETASEPAVNAVPSFIQPETLSFSPSPTSIVASEISIYIGTVAYSSPSAGVPFVRVSLDGRILA